MSTDNLIEELAAELQSAEQFTFDRQCWELAEHFLQDEPIQEGDRERMTRALAQHIQSSIESWLNSPDDQPQGDAKP